MECHLSPAETAKRFGISIKALRLYEQHSLLKPLRTSNGTTYSAWRVYDSDQLARLHQILALKSLGLSLGQIGEILIGERALAPILAAQEGALIKESKRIARALTLIRHARFKLSCGESLSIDELSILTQETVMTSHPTAKELNEILTPFKQKHFTPEDSASIQEWSAGHTDLVDAGKGMLDEAKELMASGDDTSMAAMDFASRFLAFSNQAVDSSSALGVLKPKILAAVSEAQSLADNAPKLEVLEFIKRVVINLQTREGVHAVNG